MQRIRHFFNTLSTNWSQDPAARGAAKMTAGALLVVEGLFGVLRKSTGRKKKAGGVFGAFFGMLFALVFMAVGWFVRPDPIADEQITQGEVISVASERGDDGTMYRATYGYVVAGESYELVSGMRSSSRPREGKTVEIAYSESDPSLAHRNDGLEAWFPWIFIAAGFFFFMLSGVSLLVSIALLAAGIWLFLQGRKDRQSVDDAGGFFSDLFSLVRRARQGEVDIDRTAVGQRGGSAGDVDLFSAFGAAAAASGPPDPDQRAGDLAPPSAPPEGWYPDPEDGSQMRWWDGQQWSEHRRPSA